ncbi:MAG: XRE family transcriptional regulator [Lachnospiraceae bacterium]|nr:XRE family transcriptional regulator [Lachnospiraceae bacterium]
MKYSDRIKAIRESTGMNRKEFCEFFQIPYRTMTDWERDTRHAPEYVLRLLEYYIRMEGATTKNEED